MTARLRTIVRSIIAIPPILAVVLTGIIFARDLVNNLPLTELLIALTTTLLAAGTGALSVHVARIAKRLPMRQRIFLSYSRDNAGDAQRLRDALHKQGAYVWLDKVDLEPGQEFKAETNAAIESSNTVVVVLSQSPDQSIKWELNSARERHVPIVAVVGPNVEKTPEFEKFSQILTLNSQGSNINEIAAATLQVK